MKATRSNLRLKRMAFGLRAALCASAPLWLPAFLPSTATADWVTHRGNPERTGNQDNQPGPAAPKVRWAYKAAQHFIASPVPSAKALYVSGLGALNTAQFHALAMDGDAPDRLLWTKSGPFIKLPTVSSPAVAGDLLVLGDGMHQTDGAALYCLNAVTGRPVWQFSLEGKLIHMEGAPVVAGDRVFIGGGEAGVLCVGLKRATLGGQELDVAEVQKRMDAEWDKFQAAYKKAKETDPDFAVPPGDDALPKATPKTLWHAKDRGWHVDAPLSVVGDKVLVASAYIDFDKVGKRVVAAVSAADGKPIWETPVEHNPWGGPTVAGDLVIVGCSSIRFEKKLVPEAKGQVVALELATGKVRWKRDVPGGVLSSVSVKDNLAVFAATDGKVRALNLSDGSPKWEYAGGQPFFAGPAVAGGQVYAADLKGVLHAVNLADGGKRWTLDVTADPVVQAPGMVFGSPVVHGGEVFLATNNIEGEHADLPSVVVCVSDKAPSANQRTVAKVTVDKAAGTVTIPCRIAPRKLPNLKEIYPLEVVATYPAPLGQKAHETVVNFDARPSDVHKALQEVFALSPGAPSRSEDAAGTGPEVAIYIEVAGLGGQPMRVPLEKAMVDKKTGRPLPKLKWIFTGSALRQPDPNKPDKVYAADLTGTLISIFPVTDETVFQSNLTNVEGSLLKLDVNRNLIPAEGTEAAIVIEVKK
ncbi:MAG TPA: PQQ-binding-like beta-propeller repeat protein [Humisphaera sp.]